MFDTDDVRGNSLRIPPQTEFNHVECTDSQFKYWNVHNKLYAAATLTYLLTRANNSNKQNL